MFKWPWTDLQRLNLDWILRTMKELVADVEAFADKITASATTGAAGSDASVTVTGNLNDGLNLAFRIPRGDTGATGATGPQGPQGDPGSSFGIYVFTDTAATTSAKVGVSSEQETYIPVDGDIIVLDMLYGNVQSDMTLSIDSEDPIPVYGFDGTTSPGALADANSRILLRYSNGALTQIGARANTALPNYRRGGTLNDALASNLNFTVQDIEAGTTNIYLYLNKTVADPYFIVQVWTYTGMTYELMKPSEYTINGNVEGTGNITFGLTFNSALTYPAKVVVFGNAIIGSGM